MIAQTLDSRPAGRAGHATPEARQEAVDKSATAVEDLAKAMPDSGFTGITVDPDAGVVHLYWKGALSLSARNRLKSASGRSTLDIRSTRFTRELLTAQDALEPVLFNDAAGRATRAKYGMSGAVATLDIAPDFSGLQIQAVGQQRANARSRSTMTPCRCPLQRQIQYPLTSCPGQVLESAVPYIAAEVPAPQGSR